MGKKTPQKPRPEEVVPFSVAAGSGRGRQRGDAPSAGTLRAGAVTYILHVRNT